MNTNQIEIIGYYPGVVGKITELHAVYYHDNWGFDVTFETQVGKELSEFIMAFKPERDGFWNARIHEDFAGSVAIDGRPGEELGVRLRWFITVPQRQGQGIGDILLRQAVQFCTDKRYETVYLWTFQGLDPARHLYEKHGFQLAQEHDVRQWGRHIKEQKFELSLTF